MFWKMKDCNGSYDSLWFMIDRSYKSLEQEIKDSDVVEVPKMAIFRINNLSFRLQVLSS